MNKCFFTGLECLPSNTFFPEGYVSPICGRYYILPGFEKNTKLFDKSKIGSFLCYNAIQKSAQYYSIIPTAYKLQYEQEGIKDEEAIFISPEDVDEWYPKKFSEKIDRILLFLANQSEYVGKDVSIPVGAISYLFFMHNVFQEAKQKTNGWMKELLYIWNYLYNSEYLDEDAIIKALGIDHQIQLALEIGKGDASFSFVLTPKAWQRIDLLQKTYQDTKQVFIAMSFDKSLDDANVAIQKAITNNGYLPRRMDEYRHNDQIVPEMLYQIRQSLFVVADLTGHNNGAYYEAGYAAGLGKTVILTCREDSFKDGTHFDVKQQATVIWKDEKDLQDKLTTWIEATIGKAQ